MTDLVSQLVGALNRLYVAAPTGLECSSFHHSKGEFHSHSEPCKPAAEYVEALAHARAALTAAKAGGWVAVPDCPDGDVWFALSCGHVVIGYKTGDMLDWEAMIDHDCCSDAHAVKAQPVATPTPPKDPA